MSRTLKDVVRNFSPAWFTVIMGTGAVSMIFNNFPYAHESTPMKIFSAIIFFLNVTLFILFNVLSVWRYTFWPDLWLRMIRHPVQSLYLGTYAMGFDTIINVGVALISQEYHFGGTAFLYFLWACWWYDVLLSFGCAHVLVHIMFTRHRRRLNEVTTVWILPPATLVVASSSGGILASALQDVNSSHALLTLTVSAFMVITGLVLDFMLYTMYFQRLLIYGLPERIGVLSTFIALGPTGQGGYSIMLIGQGFKVVLPLHYGSSEILRGSTTGDTINVICMCLAFIMWAITTMWMFYAFLAVQDVVCSARFPFGLPFWGLIFPNGVYANLTIALYTALDSKFFRVWGSIYAAFTVALWIAVFLQTLPLVRTGVIFSAPEVEQIDNTRNLGKEEQVESVVQNSQSTHSS